MKHIPLMFFTKHNLNYTVPLSEEPESEQDHESVVLLMGSAIGLLNVWAAFYPPE